MAVVVVVMSLQLCGSHIAFQNAASTLRQITSNTYNTLKGSINSEYCSWLHNINTARLALKLSQSAVSVPKDECSNMTTGAAKC